MAFKMSPIGKKKCPYSPMQKKGLINPSPVKENGDVKTIKFKANENKKSDPFDISQAKVDEAQARVNEKAKETGSYQEETIKADRGNLEGYASVWKRNKGGVRDKYKNYKDFVGAAEAWWEKKNKKVVGSPDPDINKSKSEIKAKAEPVDKNIGTKLITEKIIDPNAPKIYDGRLDKYVPNYIEVQRRVAVSTTADDKTNEDLDQNVTYSTTGDKDEVKNALDIDLTETQEGLENIRNEEVKVNSGGG